MVRCLISNTINTKVGVRVSKSRYEVFFFFSIHEIHHLPRALYSVGKHNSTRVDEARKCRILLLIKKKTRAKVGMGEEKSLLSDPGSELRLGREKEEEKARRQQMG